MFFEESNKTLIRQAGRFFETRISNNKVVGVCGYLKFEIGNYFDEDSTKICFKVGSRLKTQNCQKSLGKGKS